MYDYTYIVLATNCNSQVMVEQYHACARPSTALRRFVRKTADFIRDTPDDPIMVTVLDKNWKIVLAELI